MGRFTRIPLACTATAREQGRLVPRPAVDEPAGSRTSEVAVVAGGCFWGVQGVYQHTKGVTRAVSGYAGGERETAEYDRVGTGLTGHAESVQVTFDPQVITYGAILQIFFSVVHDPTELNQQGPDVGPQYRSALFPVTPEQARVAEAYIAQLNDAKIFRRRRHRLASWPACPSTRCSHRMGMPSSAAPGRS